MNTNVAEDKPKLIKYQVYLGEKLQQSLEKYIRERYAPGTSVKTAIIRQALMEFLSKRGYFNDGTKS